MRTCWFIVLESRGSWWVDCEGVAHGPLETQHEAISHARKSVEAYRDPSKQPEIWIPGPENKPVRYWSKRMPQHTSKTEHTAKAGDTSLGIAGI